MSAEDHPQIATDAGLSAEEIQRAEARQAYILGDGPRLHPMALTELSTELLDIIRRLEGANNALQSNAEGDRGGTQALRAQMLADPVAAAASPEVLADLVRLPEIVRTLLRHSALFGVHTEVGVHLHASGTLSRRDRELAVLRIGWLCQAPYEWGEHVIVAKRFGFTREDIQRVIDGPDAEGLDRHERAILRAVDELHGDAMISDATWAVLTERLDEQQLIELPIVVGHYQSTAYYQNSLRLRLHAGNPGLKAR